MRHITLVLVALGVAAAAEAQASEETLARVGWLAGCWQRTTATTVAEEQWTGPRATVMLGMGRVVRNGKLTEYEQFRLTADGAKLTYTASPSGQATTDFVSTHVSDTLLVLENPQHDYPQLISYRRVGKDSLLARIEGRINGTFRAVDFPKGRVKCP